MTKSKKKAPVAKQRLKFKSECKCDKPRDGELVRGKTDNDRNLNCYKCKELILKHIDLEGISINSDNVVDVETTIMLQGK